MERNVYFWSFAVCFFGLMAMCIALLIQQWRLENALAKEKDRSSALRQESDELFNKMTSLQEHIRKRDEQGWYHVSRSEYPEVPSVGRHARR